MNSESPQLENELERAFQERIDILFHEIELAVKWDRPSILFAIYKSESIREEVNALLQEKLKSIAQKTHCIKTNEFGFIAEISQLTDLAHTVLLIDGFQWECGKEGVRVLTEFNKHREFFIDNSVRAIFWLFEEEVSDFAENATECWILRHRVVEFEDPVQPCRQVEQPAGLIEQAAETPMEPEELSEPSFSEIENLAKSNQANASHANELLSLGITGWRKGNPQGALKYLRLAAGIAKFLGNHSLQAQCQNALALAHAELGNIEDAVAAYQNAISLSPESGFLWNNLAQLLAKNERNEEAITAYKKALECSPQDFLGWDGLGQVYLKMGLHENAIAAFEKALELAPCAEFSWSGIGKAYLESGQYEKATLALEKAVKINVHSVEAWLSMAVCFVRWERTREAVAVYQKAIEFNPQEPRLWSALGRLYLQKQDYVEGIAAFQKLVSLRPQCSQAKIDLAYAYAQIGDYETSAAIYEDNIPLFEDQFTRSKLLNQLGDTYMHLKDYEKAIGAYDQAHQLHHEVTGTENVEASALVETREMDEEEGRVPEGREPQMERGEEMNEANQVFDLRSAEQWNELGNSHLKEGAYNDAIAAYTKAIELAADTSWPYIQNLAHVHFQKGKMKGKLAAGQAEEPDLWEEDDEPETSALFDMDAIPNPERSDSFSEAGSPVPVDLDPAGQEPSPMQAGETTTAAPEACACGIYEPVDEPIKEMEIGMSDADDENTALPRQEASGQEDDLLTKTLAAISAENTPHNSIDWNEMGNSYTRSKKFNEAIEAYKKAIEMNPRYGQPYCNLGLIYYHLGKFDTAVLLFKKSTELLETREDKAASWNKLGDSYRRLGDYGAALAAYQKSSEMAPTVSPVMARARATLLENIVAG